MKFIKKILKNPIVKLYIYLTFPFNLIIPLWIWLNPQGFFEMFVMIIGSTVLYFIMLILEMLVTFWRYVI